MLKEDVPHSYAVRAVEEAVKRYKAHLDATRTRHKIILEEKQPDGSVIIKIIKEYGTSPVGSYLD